MMLLKVLLFLILLPSSLNTDPGFIWIEIEEEDVGDDPDDDERIDEDGEDSDRVDDEQIVV